MGKGLLLLRRKAAAAVFVTAVAFFCLGVNQMQNSSDIIFTKAEKQLIQIIRSLDFGEVRVIIKDSKPIRVEEIRKSIQLPSDK